MGLEFLSALDDSELSALLSALDARSLTLLLVATHRAGGSEKPHSLLTRIAGQLPTERARELATALATGTALWRSSLLFSLRKTAKTALRLQASGTIRSDVGIPQPESWSPQGNPQGGPKEHDEEVPDSVVLVPLSVILGCESRDVQYLHSQLRLETLCRALQGESEALLERFRENSTRRSWELAQEELSYARSADPRQILPDKITAALLVIRCELEGRIRLDPGLITQKVPTDEEQAESDRVLTDEEVQALLDAVKAGGFPGTT